MKIMPEDRSIKFYLRKKLVCTSFYTTNNTAQCRDVPHYCTVHKYRVSSVYYSELLQR